MKKSLLLTLFSALLLFPLMLTHTSKIASAQRFRSLSTHTNQSELYPLDSLITADTVDNDLFMSFYPDFVSLTNNFAFHDIFDDQTSGATVDDALNFFETLVEPTYNELEPGESYISYLALNDDESNASEILLYFIDDQMYYAGLTNLDLDISSGVIDEDQVTEWINQEASLTEIAALAPLIAGISQVQYNSDIFHMVMIPTTDSEGNMMIDFMILYYGQIFDSYPLPLDEALASPQDSMINIFASYFNAE